MTTDNTFILCIETSGPICSVALFGSTGLLASREESSPFSHSEKLTLMIQALFTETGIVPAQLSALAISKGPGSYTGLRIGTSVAKGLCYALNIPLLAIDTMLLLAHMAADQKTPNDNTLLIPMTDARRMEVYCAVYDNTYKALQPVHARIMDEQSFSEYNTQHIILCGDGVEKCKALFENNARITFSAVTHPSASHMGALAHRQLEEGQPEDIAYFEPCYLKDFVATKAKS